MDAADSADLFVVDVIGGDSVRERRTFEPTDEKKVDAGKKEVCGEGHEPWNQCNTEQLQPRTTQVVDRDEATLVTNQENDIEDERNVEVVEEEEEEEGKDEEDNTSQERSLYCLSFNDIEEEEYLPDISLWSSDDEDNERGEHSSCTTPKSRRKKRLHEILEEGDLDKETQAAREMEKDRAKRARRDDQEVLGWTREGMLCVNPLPDGSIPFGAAGSENAPVLIHRDLSQVLKPHQIKGVRFLWSHISIGPKVIMIIIIFMSHVYTFLVCTFSLPEYSMCFSYVTTWKQRHYSYTHARHCHYHHHHHVRIIMYACMPFRVLGAS
jgi:hypothetical protein